MVVALCWIYICGIFLSAGISLFDAAMNNRESSLDTVEMLIISLMWPSVLIALIIGLAVGMVETIKRKLK